MGWNRQACFARRFLLQAETASGHALKMLFRVSTNASTRISISLILIYLHFF